MAFTDSTPDADYREMDEFGSMRMPCTTLESETKGMFFSEATMQIIEDLENTANSVRKLSRLHSQMLSQVASKFGTACMADIEKWCLAKAEPDTPRTKKSGMAQSEKWQQTDLNGLSSGLLSLSPQVSPQSAASIGPKLVTPRNPICLIDDTAPESEEAKTPPPPGREPPRFTNVVGPRLNTPRMQPLQPVLLVGEPDTPHDDLPIEIAFKEHKYVHTTHFEDGGESLSGTLTNLRKGHVLHSVWTDIDEQALAQYLEHMKSADFYRQRSALQTPSKLSNLSLRAAVRRTGVSTTGSVNSGVYSNGVAPEPFEWIISPFSTQRLIWNIASILFVFDDVFTVPLQVFRIEESTSILITQYISRIFWTIDILMSFRTGFFDGIVLESDPREVAWRYINTSFALDAVLATIQWCKLLNGVHVLFNTIQVFRLIRLKRLSTLKKDVMERGGSNHIYLYVDTSRVAIFCLIAIHIIASGWYWIGDHVQGGWTEDAHMAGADLWYSYWFAMRWTIAQISGRTDLELRTTTEYMYTCFACVFGLIIVGLMISTITNMMIELTVLDRERLTQVYALRSYLRKNKVCIYTTRKAMTGLEAEQKAAMYRDRDVLGVLPREVMADILEEIQEPLLTRHQLFNDFFHEFPRMLRLMCVEVAKQVLVHESEVVFATGDHCTRILFLAEGLLSYHWRKRLQRTQTRISEAARSTTTKAEGLMGTKVTPKKWVSEAALWVEWENHGELAAVSASSLVGLEVTEFIAVVKKFKNARARAVLYARAFTNHLQRTEITSDLLEPLRQYLPKEPENEVVVQTNEFQSTEMESDGWDREMAVVGVPRETIQHLA